MTCSRCYGLMVEGHFLDFEGAYGQMLRTSWRCVNCGRVHDSVIEQHRLAQQKKVLALPSGEPNYQDNEVHLGAESFIRRAT
jgi:RNase P subunit RPR2